MIFHVSVLLISTVVGEDHCGHLGTLVGCPDYSRSYRAPTLCPRGHDYWTRRDLLAALPSFAKVYAQRPIQINSFGMNANHAFAMWFTARSLKPKYIVESGVYCGQGTFLLREAAPQAEIFALDPRPPRAVFYKDLGMLYGVGLNGYIYRWNLGKTQAHTWEFTARANVTSISFHAGSIYTLDHFSRVYRQSLSQTDSSSKWSIMFDVSAYAPVISIDFSGNDIFLIAYKEQLVLRGQTGYPRGLTGVHIIGKGPVQSIAVHAGVMYAVDEHLNVVKQEIQTMSLTTDWLSAWDGKVISISIHKLYDLVYGVSPDFKVCRRLLDSAPASRWKCFSHPAVTSIAVGSISTYYLLGDAFRDISAMPWISLIPPSDRKRTLVVLDDHQSSIKRVRQLARHGFIHIFYEDNINYGELDGVYSFKALCAPLPEGTTEVRYRDDFGKISKFINITMHEMNLRLMNARMEAYFEFPAIFNGCRSSETDLLNSTGLKTLSLPQRSQDPYGYMHLNPAYVRLHEER